MAKPKSGGRGRALTFFGIALVLAGGAAYGLYALVQDYERQLAEAMTRDQNVPVVIAARNLSQGTTLGAEDVTIFEVPPTFVPTTTFTRAEDVYERVPKERILQHEYIREERLAHADEGVGLNAIIPRGMRALPVNITNGSAVSGFINPGNYVDVLVSVDEVDDLEEQTLTLLQAVQVLAVDNRLGDGAVQETARRQQPSVTLALSPEDALKVTHVTRQADVTLTLRNDIDSMEVPTTGAKPTDLIGGASRRAVVRTGQRASGSGTTSDTLKIIRGSSVTIQSSDSIGTGGGASSRRRRRN